MDLRSLTERIAAQSPASLQQAHTIATDLARSAPAASAAGVLSAGSFHGDLAAAFGRAAADRAARSVKLPFTVQLQPSFKPRA